MDASTPESWFINEVTVELTLNLFYRTPAEPVLSLIPDADPDF